MVLGYGVLKTHGQQLELLSMGVVKLDKYGDSVRRLKVIHEKVSGLIDQYAPQDFAIEAPFFGKNVQSMLKLGRAQGVAIAAALVKGLEVYEYSPKKIKQSVTGSGNASKEQVAAMLQTLCHFELKPRFLDATDGLAAAVCHHLQFKPALPGALAGKSYSGWKDFLSQNEKRIK